MTEKILTLKKDRRNILYLVIPSPCYSDVNSGLNKQ